jgi:spermidine/putrescine-binding protein
MKQRIMILAFFLTATMLISCGKKTPTLSLLVWEGYADPSFVSAFEESHHCKISASYMGSR